MNAPHKIELSLASDKLSELHNVEITSATGHTERRNTIRSWSPEDVVTAHNALIRDIIERGEITETEQHLLLAFSQEGLGNEGKFYGKIVESSEHIAVPHVEHARGTTFVARWKVAEILNK